MRKSGLIYPLMLLVCWTGFIIVGNYVVLETTVRQFLARKFPVTEGKIVLSQMGQGPVSRRGVEIEYNYTVGGINYTGRHYRYDDRNEAIKWDDTIHQYPRWSERKVYYNPENPADSLLAPGIDGCDLLLLLFAMPLDVVTYVLWSAMRSRLRDNRPVRLAGGVRILKGAEGIRVPLTETSALEAGLYALAIVTFILAFPVVTFAGFEPTMREMKLTWAFALAVAACVLIGRAIRNRSGIYDLRVDPASKTVTLPQMGGRKEPLSISQRAIAGVCMQRRSSKTPSGTYFTYLPALNPMGPAAESQTMPLVTWGWSEERARAFSQWLSQELAVEFKGIEEEKA